MRVQKLELQHFIGEHIVDVCLFSEIHIKPVESFRHANFVCHYTDRLSFRVARDILVCRGVVHNAVPLSGLTQLEATSTAYVSPSLPLIVVVLTDCLLGDCRS